MLFVVYLLIVISVCERETGEKERGRDGGSGCATVQM